MVAHGKSSSASPGSESMACRRMGLCGNLGDPDGSSLKEDEYAKQSLQGEGGKHGNGSRMVE